MRPPPNRRGRAQKGGTPLGRPRSASLGGKQQRVVGGTTDDGSAQPHGTRQRERDCCLPRMQERGGGRLHAGGRLPVVPCERRRHCRSDSSFRSRAASRGAASPSPPLRRRLGGFCFSDFTAYWSPIEGRCGGEGESMKSGRFAVAWAVAVVGLTVVPPAFAATAERISVSATGEQGNGGSFSAAISADGRYTVFVSYASNLVSGDTNDACDVFVRDNSNGGIELVSVSSSGEQVVTQSCLVRPAISADGRFVAFHSDAVGLVLNDTSTNSDIFVRDRELGTTERMSVGSNGETALGNGTEYATSLDPAISADGRLVAFMSSGRNLIADREIYETHVYVRDRLTGATEIVSERSDQQPTNGPAAQPSLSADGRYVAFVSYSEGLVPGDDNLGPDVFVRDRASGTTTAASVSSTEALPDYISGRPQSEQPSISGDGRYVAFSSNASDLVPGDDYNDIDVFVRDRVAGTTRMGSVTATGEQAYGGDSVWPSISADGRHVAFHSSAGNLSPGGGFGTYDIILFDAASGVTKPLTIGQDYDEDDSIFASLTADGKI